MADYIDPGHVRLRVCNPSLHWEPTVGHGHVSYPHVADPDGNVYVVLPRAAAQALLRNGCGYVIAD
jgi:hypothetical protein